MRVYTVTKSNNNDREFQAYIDLLEEIGIDITNVPRTPEMGTQNRWLYVWESKIHAERFARLLSERLRDPSWRVHEFDLSEEERGPLAPLIIWQIPTKEGAIFRLDSKSQTRVMNHFPNAKLAGEVYWPKNIRDDYEKQNGPVWDQAILVVTGIPEESVDFLGGARILSESGTVLYNRIPANVNL